MRIDIWSDLVCPWCWIGKHRLRRALELLGDDAPPVEIHWHPFLLDPGADATPVPLREAYAAKFGGAGRAGEILAQTQDTARAEGLPMDFDRGQVRVTTLPGHRLMWLAAREGDADAVGEALFRAHFAEGRNLADPEVLAAAGAEGGLDAARVRAMLDSDEGLAEVRAALGRAQAMGIRAVPTFVIDGRQGIQGAHPPEALADVLRELAPPPAAGQDDGGRCGPEGCEA
ncbi:polyketide synthase [Luteimonas padinae]|uniref:DsbA family oxidoreductase n=1 Tax=Luteimonas padinae TaxID=1714359 RepID=A0ABV6SUW3_9GAMM|nr:DsbA family oxidoreductase [Luteimonas padinae]GHD74025.1 polyketide synthase [Luteimonas padinae]